MHIRAICMCSELGVKVSRAACQCLFFEIHCAFVARCHISLPPGTHMQTPLLKSKVQKAAQQLRALMPAIPWEGRLMQDSNLFMTFITLLDDVNFGSGSVSSR